MLTMPRWKKMGIFLNLLKVLIPIPDLFNVFLYENKLNIDKLVIISENIY